MKKNGEWIAPNSAHIERCGRKRDESQRNQAKINKNKRRKKKKSREHNFRGVKTPTKQPQGIFQKCWRGWPRKNHGYPRTRRKREQPNKKQRRRGAINIIMALRRALTKTNIYSIGRVS